MALLGNTVNSTVCVGADHSGSGMDAEKGRKDFLADASRLVDVLGKIYKEEPPDVIPIVATLGHGFASGSFPECLSLVKGNYPDAVVLAWAITPFTFQGNDVRNRSLDSIRNCVHLGHTVTPLSNQIAYERLGLNTTMSVNKLYEYINTEITNVLASTFSSLTTDEGVIESMDRNDLKKIWTGECSLIGVAQYPDLSNISEQSLKDAEEHMLLNIHYTSGDLQPTATYIADGPGEFTISQMQTIANLLATKYKANMKYFKPLIINRPREVATFTLIRGNMRLSV